MAIVSMLYGAGGASSAEDVSYDNTTSGLEADNVQDAIDEVNSNLVYSENETVIGKMDDGRPVYRRIFKWDISSSNNVYTWVYWDFPHYLNMISVDGFFEYRTPSGTVNEKAIIPMILPSDFQWLLCVSNFTATQLQVTTGSGWVNYPVKIVQLTVTYTKE